MPVLGTVMRMTGIVIATTMAWLSSVSAGIHDETLARERTVSICLDTARRLGTQSKLVDAAVHSRAKFRERIENSRNEHVAGYPA